MVFKKLWVLMHWTKVASALEGLTLMLLLANFANTKFSKKLKNDWNPGKWVLIWEYSERAFQWVPTWQGLGVFQKSLRPCALNRMEHPRNVGCSFFFSRESIISLHYHQNIYIFFWIMYFTEGWFLDQLVDWFLLTHWLFLTIFTACLPHHLFEMHLLHFWLSSTLSMLRLL